MPRRIINNWKITKGVPLTKLDKKFYISKTTVV